MPIWFEPSRVSGVDDPVGQKDFARALGMGFGQIVNQRDTTGTRALGGVLLPKYIHRHAHSQKSHAPSAIFIEINTQLSLRMLVNCFKTSSFLFAWPPSVFNIFLMDYISVTNYYTLFWRGARTFFYPHQRKHDREVLKTTQNSCFTEAHRFQFAYGWGAYHNECFYGKPLKTSIR